MSFVNFRDCKPHYNTDDSGDGLSSVTSELRDVTMDNESNVTHYRQDAPLDNVDRDRNQTGNEHRSRRSSIASNNSYFSVRQSLSLLPVFDGQNIPVHQFTADCKGVFELVDPDDKLFFFRAILQTKLIGEAAIARTLYNVANVDELCSLLEREFGKCQSFEQWKLEVTNLRQYRNESLEDYVTRTRRLNVDMMLAISQYPDQAARAGIKTFAANKLINNFLGGLLRHIGQHLVALKFQTLDEAIESAVNVMTRTQFHENRLRAHYQNDSPFCNYYRRTGHYETECRSRLYRARNQYSNFRSNNRYYDRNNYTPTHSNLNANNSYTAQNNQSGRFYGNHDRDNFNHTTSRPTYNRFDQSQNFARNNSSENRGSYTENYRGQARSAQRLGQQLSRANPIETTEQAIGHTTSERPPETSFASHSTNSKAQQNGSC